MSGLRYFLANCDNIVENAVDLGNELNVYYDRVANSLENAIWKPRTNIYFYGSRLYGLASDISDLDIFVDVTYDDEGSRSKKFYTL